jgi:hypothetical protein
MSNVSDIPVRKSDTEKAQELKEAMLARLKEVCAVMQEARDSGLEITFNIAPNAYGKLAVAGLAVSKMLATL